MKGLSQGDYMGANQGASYVYPNTQAGLMKIGSYTGDGNATQVIAMPFLADYIEIYSPNVATLPDVTIVQLTRFRADAAAMEIKSTNTVPITTEGRVLNVGDGIAAIAVGSFTVTLAEGYNTTGKSYYFRATSSGVFP